MSDDWKILPMLASQDNLTEAEAKRLLCLDIWRLSQKIDGVRLLIHVHDGKVVGINRKGAIALIPEPVAEPFRWMTGEWCFDGELVGRGYHVFDMPRALEIVTPSLPYGQRREILEGLWQGLEMPDEVSLVPCAVGTEAKTELGARVRANHGEGVMFKKADSAYRSTLGNKRSNDHRKRKFTNDVDCIVTALGIDGKQNMAVGLVDPSTGEIIEVAEVTALAGDGPRVSVGDVVTIKCLYASEDDRLVQPTLPRLRDDKPPAECVMGQLASIKTNKEVLT